MSHRCFIVVVSLALVGLLAASAPVIGADAVAGEQTINWARGGTPGPITGPAAQAIQRGPLPADPVNLAERKALEATVARAPELATLAAPAAPTVLLGRIGLVDTSFITPSDSTGAIGTTRYVETINSLVGIYDRSLILLDLETLANFWAEQGASCFDPQIMWDATTNRFYYAGDAIVSDSDNRIAFGFSKTSSPSDPVTDWCHYDISYGTEFPDYPKLGDSRDFLIIGVNVFSNNSTGGYRGSDIVAITKPPAGATCPDPSSFTHAFGRNIKVGGSTFFTPTPANEIDGSPTGWVVAIPSTLPATQIGLFKVTKNATTGGPVIQTAGAAITVPSYDMPPNAPQQGTAFPIDTLDGRFTQAVAAIDPNNGGKLAIWTQHAVAGGAGSMERWYEIDPVGRVVLQRGNVASTALFYFNGAISPDRVVKGAARAFGQSMVLNFTASSATSFPSIRMVSKIGANPMSMARIVKSSPGPNIDFACAQLGLCRWGDYAAASPDPNAPANGTTGIVWGTNMWTKDGNTTGGTGGTSWRTWNWQAQP